MHIRTGRGKKSPLGSSLLIYAVRTACRCYNRNLSNHARVFHGVAQKRVKMEIDFDLQYAYDHIHVFVHFESVSKFE